MARFLRNLLDRVMHPMLRVLKVGLCAVDTRHLKLDFIHAPQHFFEHALILFDLGGLQPFHMFVEAHLLEERLVFGHINCFVCLTVNFNRFHQTVC